MRNPNIDAFDSEADVLERLDAYGPEYVQQTGAFISRLELPPHERGTIIDLGCSLGNLSRALLEAFPEAKVIGIDGAPKLIEIGRRRLGKEPRVSFIVSAFEELDWAALPRDCAAVVAVHALEHVAPDMRRRIFSHIHSILRDGGIFLDQEWARDTTPTGVDPRDRSRPEHTPEFIREAIAEGRITEEEHWRLWDKLAQPATHHFMELEAQLAALRGAGFPEVSGEWLNEANTLVRARR